MSTSPPASPMSVGRTTAWMALAIALAMIGWRFIRTELPPPGDLPPAQVELGYPDWDGRVRHVEDRRGRPAPSVLVDEWLGDAPELGDRVVVVEFWATWCGPCLASIPHFNELIAAHGDRAAFVALSNESREQVETTLDRIGQADSGFAAAVGMDPAARMAGALMLGAVPHTLVMSRDGIVRWQGLPASLDSSTLAAIIEADARQAEAG